MKPFPCIESTLEVTYDRTTVRLWIDRVDIPEDPFAVLVPTVIALQKALWRKMSHKELLESLSSILNLNAVQIIQHDPRPDNVQAGTVIYTVPFEDVHG